MLPAEDKVPIEICWIGATDGPARPVAAVPQSARSGPSRSPFVRALPFRRSRKTPGTTLASSKSGEPV
jgi:hypothetical protein